MTITHHSLELKWRIFYLLVSYFLTASLLGYAFPEWLGWVFWPFYSSYPKIQWQYHYGLEAFYIFWQMTLEGAILWMTPWILLQWHLYQRIGQWKKDSSSVFSIWKVMGCFLLGYALYYWGYPWFLLGHSSMDLGILVQPTVSDLVQWFYRCLIFPCCIYGTLRIIRNLSFWKALILYRHYYWLACLLIGGWITPPDGFSQLFILGIGVLGLEWQVLRIFFRDVTKR